MVVGGDVNVLTEDQIRDWDTDLRALTEQIAGPLFIRPEPRESFVDLVRGLLAEVPRKNSWQLADHVGHSSDGCRHDSAALKISGILESLSPKNLMGDKGYVGAGMLTPIKKPACRNLPSQ